MAKDTSKDLDLFDDNSMMMVVMAVMTIAILSNVMTNSSSKIAPALATAVEYDAKSNPVYVGESYPGATVSDTAWRIRKLFYDISGNVVNVKWAEGNADFVFVWDDRNTYSYV